MRYGTTMNHEHTSHVLPTVSVLAPCRNEVDFIRDAIQSILDNDYPAELVEILVLDGMSTDGTREIVQEISKQSPSVRLVDNTHKIVPTAMNIGIKEAKGEYIIRIDCHAEFANDYIRKCIEVSQRTGAANVGGYWLTLPGANTSVARAIMLATSSRFGVGNSAFRTGGGNEMVVDTVPFGTFRKSIFSKVGPYDERLVRNQDIELNSRIRKMDEKIIISPEIELSYINRATLQGIWQQSFNNGLWNPYTVWLTGSALRIRHFVPLFFVLGLIFLAAGSIFSGVFTIGFVGCLSLYAAIAFTAASRQEPKARGSTIPLVIVSFFILHFAYGLGTIWGVATTPFKFPRRCEQNVGRALSDRRN